MIGGTKHFLILKISIKSVWMFLWWLQTSLLFCNNVSKSLSWSLSITLSALSYTLFIKFTARKTLFSLSKCSEKMVFPKKLHWNMIFLVSSAKMVFLFSKNMTLFFRRKMKDDLSQKYLEIWYILQIFWKDGLSKNIALKYDPSSIIRKDGISFSRKYDMFSTDGKWKIVFLKKYIEVWCFLYVR